MLPILDLLFLQRLLAYLMISRENRHEILRHSSKKLSKYFRLSLRQKHLRGHPPTGTADKLAISIEVLLIFDSVWFIQGLIEIKLSGIPLSQGSIAWYPI